MIQGSDLSGAGLGRLLHRQHAERAVFPLLHDVAIVLLREQMLTDLLDGVRAALSDLLVGHRLVARSGGLGFVPLELDQVVQSIPVGAGLFEIHGSRLSGEVLERAYPDPRSKRRSGPRIAGASPWGSRVARPVGDAHRDRVVTLENADGSGLLHRRPGGRAGPMSSPAMNIDHPMGW